MDTPRSKILTTWLTGYTLANYKQLLDEVFVMSRIIKGEVGAISQSQRLRLITLTKTSQALILKIHCVLLANQKRVSEFNVQ